MYNSKIRTMLKLVWYLRPWKNIFLKTTVAVLLIAAFISIPVPVNITLKVPGIVYLLLIILPFITSYFASRDFLSLLHRAENKKAILYDFENSSAYLDGNVRLGELFLFSRKGGIPILCKYIREIDLGWVAEKGYGIAITTKKDEILVVSENGALPLTRGEGRERYRPFIRELLRRNPGIAHGFGEDEEKHPYLNGNTETGKTLKNIVGYEMREYIRPPKNILGNVILSFLYLFISAAFCYAIYRLSGTPRSGSYPNQLVPALLMRLFLLIFISAFISCFTDNIKKFAKSRDFELKMQSFRADGLGDRMIRDFQISVPYLDNQLRFGEKYLFPYRKGMVYEYSQITNACHYITFGGKGNKFYIFCLSTKNGDLYRFYVKKRYFRGAGWFDEYCLPIEEELRKKNPNIKSYPFA